MNFFDADTPVDTPVDANSDTNFINSDSSLPKKRGRKPKHVESKEEDDDKNETTTESEPPENSIQSHKKSKQNNEECFNPNLLNGNSNNNNSNNNNSKKNQLHVLTSTQIHKIKQEYEFQLNIKATLFQELVKLVSPVLENIPFKVVSKNMKSGERFNGICVNSMDNKKVSMIVARITADELIHSDEEDNYESTFCVSSSTLSVFLKLLKQDWIEIKKRKDQSVIDFRSFNFDKDTFQTEFSIPTLDKEEPVEHLNTMNYNFIADMDLSMLKNFTQVAQNTNINAQNLGLKIYEGFTENKENKVNKVCVNLDSGPGNPTINYTFRTATNWDHKEDSRVIISTSDSLENNESFNSVPMKLKFDEIFSSKHLHLFLKQMEGTTVTLKLSPGKPMVLVYPFGDGEGRDHCHFIIAPSVKENDD